MVQQLVLLTVVAACGALFSTDSKCQNDSAALLQVANVPETFPFEKTALSSYDSDWPVGRAGSENRLLVDMNDSVMTSMNDWNSSRDLARVWGVQNVTISSKWTLQIFSAVPVFGKDESYIALIVEHNGDALVQGRERWTHDFDAFVMFCAGPDGSHKAQVIARGNTWVCPWPHEEWETKRFSVFLEDKDGTNLGMVVAEHDPKLLGHYKTMACVRDVFYVPHEKRAPRLQRPFSGPFKQWVEWMEWTSMHGLEHFLVYTFEGTDLGAKDLVEPYLDAGIASRVHFNFFHPIETVRQGHFTNDCIYRAKNHAKWLTTSMDVDEYMVFPNTLKYFNFDNILKQQGICGDKVASLEVPRVRFARARPEFFEISSDHRVPSFDFTWPKQVINVDNVYRTSVHILKEFKAGTATVKVDPKFAVLRHYRLPGGNVDYENYDFNDPEANMTDTALQKEIPSLEAAIARRFNMQASAVKGFLKNLVRKRPPDAYIAAAAHKMQ